MRGRGVVALHRHHRQPRVHARVAGRPGARWRHGGSARGGGVRAARSGRLSHSHPRWHAPSGGTAGQQCRPVGAGIGALHRRVATVLRAAGLLCQRQLLFARGALPLHPPDLSRAGKGRAGCAPHAGPGRAGQVRAGCAVGPGAGRPACGSRTRRGLLCTDPQVLARPGGRRTAAGLCRHPAQAPGAWRGPP